LEPPAVNQTGMQKRFRGIRCLTKEMYGPAFIDINCHKRLFLWIVIIVNEE
jgi:hypothetical protein